MNTLVRLRNWLLEKCETKQQPRKLVAEASKKFGVRIGTAKREIHTLIDAGDLTMILNGYYIIRRGYKNE